LDDAEQRDDGGLVRGDRIEIAHIGPGSPTVKNGPSPADKGAERRDRCRNGGSFGPPNLSLVPLDISGYLENVLS
jgi:hypothetical protein